MNHKIKTGNCKFYSGAIYTPYGKTWQDISNLNDKKIHNVNIQKTFPEWRKQTMYVHRILDRLVTSFVDLFLLVWKYVRHTSNI